MLRIIWMTLMMVVGVSVFAWACPTCAATGNQRFFFQTFIALCLLWIIPVSIVGFVIYKVMSIQKHERTNSQVPSSH